MNKVKIFISLYFASIVGLFLYSFTQVDLSLTLSKASFYQSVQKYFQYLGFYQRTNSAILFAVILILLFAFYLIFLNLARKQKLSLTHAKILILLTFIPLVFSYNAFSYDLFNYIFDAKILTFYHLNPYLFKPMDFASDPMLNFMRWTHRVYPYGPSWLALTVPLSYLGLNIFLPTFFLFKTMIGLTYVGSVFLVYKISEILFPKEKIFNTVFFALNPLVIIESLVSAHNDFPMIFFALLAIYLLVTKKRFFSFLSILFSIGVKYATVVLVPIFAIVLYFEKTKRNINWEKVFIASALISLVAILLASVRTTFQPWYLMLAFSMSAFVAKKYYIFIPVLVSSITCTLVYVVYVYMTDYAKNYPQTIFQVEVMGVIAVFVLTGVYFMKALTRKN